MRMKLMEQDNMLIVHTTIFLYLRTNCFCCYYCRRLLQKHFPTIVHMQNGVEHGKFLLKQNSLNFVPIYNTQSKLQKD